MMVIMVQGDFLPVCPGVAAEKQGWSVQVTFIVYNTVSKWKDKLTNITFLLD